MFNIQGHRQLCRSGGGLIERVRSHTTTEFRNEGGIKVGHGFCSLIKGQVYD